MELHQIILAHHVEIKAGLIHSFLSDDNVKTYLLTPSEYLDFKYLLSDLTPDLFLIHEEVLLANKDIIEAQLNEFPEIRLGLITSNSPALNLDKFAVVIHEPFDPSDLYNKMKSQLV